MTKASDLKPGDKVRLTGEMWQYFYTGDWKTVTAVHGKAVLFQGEPQYHRIGRGYELEKIEEKEEMKEMEAEKAGAWVVWDWDNEGSKRPRSLFENELDALRAMNEMGRTDAEGVMFWEFGKEW